MAHLRRVVLDLNGLLVVVFVAKVRDCLFRLVLKFYC